MSEKGIKEKIEDIIEELLSAILTGIKKTPTSELSWRIVHNSIKDLSILMRIQGKLGKVYPNKKENMMDISPLLFLALMNKELPLGMNELKHPPSLEDGILWQKIFDMLNKLKKGK